MDDALRHLITRSLPRRGTVLVAADSGLDPDDVAAARARPASDLSAAAPGSVAAVVLTDDALSHAGEHAETLVDTIGTALEPGGILVVTVRSRIHAEHARLPLEGVRPFSAVELSSLLHHRGFGIDVLCAPGAAAGLRGETGFDPEADRAPGLLDAAPHLLAIASAPRSAEQREHVFFSTRPRKIVAAAVLCRAPDGRVLLVHDRFKGSWTIPGGVVDADEDPAAAAQREAWEEAGIKVHTDRVLGVFAARWPDRLVFVYGAMPVEVIERPRPVHPHEISAVAWVPLGEALERVASPVAFKIRSCLESPGFSWAV